LIVVTVVLRLNIPLTLVDIKVVLEQIIERLEATVFIGWEFSIKSVQVVNEFFWWQVFGFFVS